jgi:hypothetical protein
MTSAAPLPLETPTIATSARIQACWDLASISISEVTLVDARFLRPSRKADVNSEILKNCNNGTQDQYTSFERTAFGSGVSPIFAFKR